MEDKRNLKFNKKPNFRLIKIWLMVASRAAQTQLLTNWGGLLFLIGKIVRFSIFLVFLLTVSGPQKIFLGYSKQQVIIFYLIFNLMDSVSQFLFRGAYLFRNLIVTGNYDLDLLKPLPSYFRPVFGWTDILDFLTLPPLLFYLFWYLEKNFYLVSIFNLIQFFFLFAIGLTISFAFHLIICAVCVLTTEIDSLILIYRDISSMGRFPIDIYPQIIQDILTFIIPIAVMMTIPAKALTGLLSWQGMIIPSLIGVFFSLISFRFWRFALRKYSSASS